MNFYVLSRYTLILELVSKPASALDIGALPPVQSSPGQSVNAHCASACASNTNMWMETVLPNTKVNNTYCLASVPMSEITNRSRSTLHKRIRCLLPILYDTLILF